jgi:hypothetical protein
MKMMYVCALLLLAAFASAADQETEDIATEQEIEDYETEQEDTTTEEEEEKSHLATYGWPLRTSSYYTRLPYYSTRYLSAPLYTAAWPYTRSLNYRRPLYLARSYPLHYATRSYYAARPAAVVYRRPYPLIRRSCAYGVCPSY